MPLGVTTLSTPRGRCSAATSASSSAVAGASGLGLSTAVQPVTSAGATFHIAMRIGKLNGLISEQTPTGSRRT